MRNGLVAEHLSVNCYETIIHKKSSAFAKLVFTSGAYIKFHVACWSGFICIRVQVLRSLFIQHRWIFCLQNAILTVANQFPWIVVQLFDDTSNCSWN